MGDFEIFFSTMSITILGFVIYNLVNAVSFRDLLKRFGFLKIARRDFYECGFRPTTQKPVRVPVQFLLICVFFFTIRYRTSVSISASFCLHFSRSLRSCVAYFLLLSPPY